MPSITQITAWRQNRQNRARRFTGIGRVLWGFLTLLIIMMGAFTLTAALILAELSVGLPGVESIEEQFGKSGEEVFIPVRFYDRSGEYVLHERMHPLASERRWLRMDGLGEYRMPSSVVQAMIAIHQPDYWSKPDSNLWRLSQSLLGGYEPNKPPEDQLEISERLVEVHMIPPSDQWLPAPVRRLRRGLLASKVVRRYSKEQILEWYINSAHYGNSVYGIDAAALVYLHKHASNLSLAESAFLAGISAHPERNPIDDPVGAKDLQVEVLDAMVQQGWIRRAEAERARLEPIKNFAEAHPFLQPLSDFLRRSSVELEALGGSSMLHRSGLKIITTMDVQVQAQIDCLFQYIHEPLDRPAGKDGLVAYDGSSCVVLDWLPSSHIDEVTWEPSQRRAGMVVLDPSAGEILGLSGPITEPSVLDDVSIPFIYLAAFSQGYGPGSMAFDYPLEIDSDQARTGTVGSVRVEDSHGLVRMRVALANAYPYAARRILEQVGIASVLRIANQMGVAIDDRNEKAHGSVASLDWAKASLINMSAAYGVMANHGVMVGQSMADLNSHTSDFSPQPTSILAIQDQDGNSLYSYEPSERIVLSSSLAYLMTDALSDPDAWDEDHFLDDRLEFDGQIGFVFSDASDRGQGWMFGFTPTRLVGMWMENATGVVDLQEADTHTLFSLGYAALRYANEAVEPQGWLQPSDVVELEVCDPSGLLPTPYCPKVVQEVFVQGTEPKEVDSLYHPFWVNTETGRLATLDTPMDMIEERVYLVPPSEAVEWMNGEGVQRPPTEYDTHLDERETQSGVEIHTPHAFEFVAGEVTIGGKARVEDFKYYRLKYGGGLFPTDWIQIGENTDVPVKAGILGQWDTSGLNGLYALQLQVVGSEGQLQTDHIYVRVDNQPPAVEIVWPLNGEKLPWPQARTMPIQAEISDNYGLERVDFYVGDQMIESRTSPPYSLQWTFDSPVRYQLEVRAYDQAGNQTMSDTITIEFIRDEE